MVTQYGSVFCLWHSLTCVFQEGPEYTEKTSDLIQSPRPIRSTPTLQDLLGSTRVSGTWPHPSSGGTCRPSPGDRELQEYGRHPELPWKPGTWACVLPPRTAALEVDSMGLPRSHSSFKNVKFPGQSVVPGARADPSAFSDKNGNRSAIRSQRNQGFAPDSTFVSTG